MPYEWKSATIAALAEFPTAIWWLMEKGEESRSFTENLRLGDLPIGALYGAGWREASTFDLFGASRASGPALETSSIEFFGEIPGDILKKLIELAGNEGLAAPILDHRSVCAAGCDIEPATPNDQPDVSEETIVIGIIDDTIAIANENFRNVDGTTRFAHFWQQDAACVCGEQGTKVRFGREFSFAEIDEAFRQATIGGMLDEDAVYRLLDMDSPLQSEPNRFGKAASHGTHVADLAGGISPGGTPPNDPLRDAAPEHVRLIGVNLPTNVVADTAGTYFEISAVLGVARILAHVGLMERKWQSAHPERDPISIPVVINLSFGLTGGGRKGSALLEQYMDHCVQARAREGLAPLRFVLPAGNHYQARLVGTYKVTSGGHTDIKVRVAPDSRASTFIEIRVAGPVEVPPQSRVVADVIPPFDVDLISGQGRINPGLQESVDMYQLWLLVDNDGEKPSRKSAIFYSWRPELARSIDGKQPGHETITVAIPPNSSDNEHRRLPPPGVWTIRLRTAVIGNGHRIEEVEVEVRVLRNDIPTRADPTPQRSRLDDPCFAGYEDSGFLNEQPFDSGSPISRASSINALATGRETIVVGAVRASDGEFAPYSAAGPIEGFKSDGSDDGVIVTTIGDDGLTMPGVRASGTRSGSSVRLSGTSVAAPQVARIVAGQMLSWHKTKDPELGSIGWLKDLATQERFGPTKPAIRAGAGGIRSRRRPVG